MIDIEFRSFGKIARLFRDVVITEKIDGTNAAIGIVEVESDWDVPDGACTVITYPECTTYAVYAQSRKRLITPDKDNHGFARWVYENALTLVRDLGPGLHFGEWWGSGIQRGYGLEKGEKRFSLFNVKRWAEVEFTTPGVASVPVLYRGLLDTENVRYALDILTEVGSLAAPGFDRPEGVVIYHTASNGLFKVTIENDEAPKSLVAP